MSGWICLHREIQNHWVYQDAEKFKAWVDLILSANHEDRKFEIKGQLIECKRGQLGFSQKTLATRWNWSRPRVQRFIELLVSDGMINTKCDHLTTIITICNYSDYQDTVTPGVTPDVTPGVTPGVTPDVTPVVTPVVTPGVHLALHQSLHKQQLNNKTIKQKEKRYSVFSKPTLTEINDFCETEKIYVDASAFINHYESNGWMVGRNKMKDWKATARNWALRNKQQNNAPPALSTPPVRRIV